jgi:hypothetical protein
MNDLMRNEFQYRCKVRLLLVMLITKILKNQVSGICIHGMLLPFHRFQMQPSAHAIRSFQ